MKSPGFTCSWIQWNPSGASGDPVRPSCRTRERSATSRGTTPAFIAACTKAALVPKNVVPVRSASCHSASGPGWAGLPSYSTAAAPTERTPSAMFHITHPVVVNQKSRSPGPISRWKAGLHERLEQDAAVAVHERLRHPRRPGGEHDPQRVRELDLREDRLDRRFDRRERVVPSVRARRSRPPRARAGTTVASSVGSPARISASSAVRSCDTPAEPVAVDREQHLRVELAEPVEHRAHAELGGAGRPHRAEAGDGEERDDRLGHVRQQRDDAVALPRRRAAAARAAPGPPRRAARRT